MSYIFSSKKWHKVVHEEFLLGKSIQGARVYLYPHLHFSLGFNNDQVVSANVTTDPKRRVDITDVSMGQEVIWLVYIIIAPFKNE
jgi:hypothetical protein